MISIIVAMDKNQLIGKNDSPNGIPWNNKEDMKHFKETTINQTICMGYTTYKAIGRPLPKRHNIVVCYDKFDDERVEVRTSLMEVINEYKTHNKDLYITGGASIYKQALPYVDQLLISRIPGDYTGETYFPDFSEYGFKLVETTPKETFQLEIYQRGNL